MSDNAIILFQDDFRINDNPALHYACKMYKNVIPLYIHQENYLGRQLGGASKVFLHSVLQSFDHLLHTKYGIHLIIRCGNVIEHLTDIIKNYNVNAV